MHLDADAGRGPLAGDHLLVLEAGRRLLAGLALQVCVRRGVDELLVTLRRRHGPRVLRVLCQRWLRPDADRAAPVCTSHSWGHTRWVAAYKGKRKADRYLPDTAAATTAAAACSAVRRLGGASGSCVWRAAHWTAGSCEMLRLRVPAVVVSGSHNCFASTVRTYTPSSQHTCTRATERAATQRLHAICMVVLRPGYYRPMHKLHCIMWTRFRTVERH